MAVRQHTHDGARPDSDDYPVRADLTVLVTRDADGDLTDGVRARLDDVDVVAGVERVDVGGLRPSLNDLRVDVTASLRVRGPPDDPEAVAAALADGFGVREVAAVERR
jgi:hypothetical protein